MICETFTGSLAKLCESAFLEICAHTSEESKNMTRVSFIAAIAAAAGVATAGDLYHQDFETASDGYTTSVTEFSDGFGDFFTQSDGTNIGSFVNYSGADGSFFAGMDLDGEGASPPLYLTTDTFSIAGATNLMFAIDLAEDDDGTNQDWDDSDYVYIEYSIDGGSWTNIFTVEGDGSQFNSEPQVNGTAVTDTFATFNADLSALSGSNLAIRLVWQLNAGDEDLAIDNLRIFGDVAAVPLPPAAFAGLGMLGLMAGAKLRRK
jgi:hypothetical protein